MTTPTKASAGSPNTSAATSAMSSARPSTATSKPAESQTSQRTIGDLGTKECDGWRNHDKRSGGRSLPPAPAATAVTVAPRYPPLPVDDHGTTAPGGWRDRPET